jgi:hypothetical protein
MNCPLILSGGEPSGYCDIETGECVVTPDGTVEASGRRLVRVWAWSPGRRW